MDKVERLIVGNGSKLVERAEENGKWVAYKVENQGNLKNGVYPLHQAKSVSASSKGVYSGTILHADKQSVYQDQGDKGIVRFDRHAFKAVPEIGRTVTVNYEYGLASVNDNRLPPSAAAAVVAMGKAIDASNLPATQRAIVEARMRENVNNSLTKGHAPDVKIREAIEVRNSHAADRER